MSNYLGGIISATYDPFAAGSPTTVEYLVVAGGGSGGGYDNGGGGGAGGLVTATGLSTGLPVTVGTTYTITIGAGGASVTYDGGATNPQPGNAGTNSVFGSITATGGGYGGSGSANPGTNRLGGDGGSGGGGGISGTATGNNLGGSGTAGQGFDGGTGAEWGGGLGLYAGGGGGGAGGVGGSALTNLGVGGPGLCSTITGSRVFYAGGGGGGNNTHFAPGGGGGGGSGAINTGNIQATSGLPNTGGGGGGASAVSYSTSGTGGSGIVIIRYPADLNPPTSFGGSNRPQISYADGYQIYIWTGSATVTF